MYFCNLETNVAIVVIEVSSNKVFHFSQVVEFLELINFDARLSNLDLMSKITVSLVAYDHALSGVIGINEMA